MVCRPASPCSRVLLCNKSRPRFYSPSNLNTAKKRKLYHHEHQSSRLSLTVFLSYHRKLLTARIRFPRQTLDHLAPVSTLTPALLIIERERRREVATHQDSGSIEPVWHHSFGSFSNSRQGSPITTSLDTQDKPKLPTSPTLIC